MVMVPKPDYHDGDGAEISVIPSLGADHMRGKSEES